MTAYIVQGNALHLPLPDESVDLIVTSPPYFALRSYQDDGAHYAGQIGSEETPQLFLEALWKATEEMVRVLKSGCPPNCSKKHQHRLGGSIFVDLGDKYAGSGSHNQFGAHGTGARTTPLTYNKSTHLDGIGFQGVPGRTAKVAGIRSKSLLLLPERYRIGCVDRLGLIAREVLVWNKPNGLPESVRDRARRSHEDWVHLVKSPRYFSAVDEIRESYNEASLGRYAYRFGVGEAQKVATSPSVGDGTPHEKEPNPLGKLPGSVWSIPSEPLLIPEWARTKYDLPDHFAAFPQEWPRRLVLGWSPNGICVECGEGRRPVVDRRLEEKSKASGRPKQHDLKRPKEDGTGSSGWDVAGYPLGAETATITGYACACTPYTDHPGTGEKSPTPTATATGRQGDRPVDIGSTHRRVGPWREYHLDGWTPPDTRPAVVLDPFGGTGTVALVADALGREGISIDLSRDYCRLARWRIEESGHGKKALSRTWAERQGTLSALSADKRSP